MRLITGLTYNFIQFVLYSDDCLDATQFAPNKHGLCQNCNFISSFKKLPNDGFCGCHVRPWTFWRHAPKPPNISVDWENFKERFRFHLCIEIISRHVLTFTTYTLRPEVCACKIREGGTNRARVPSGAAGQTNATVENNGWHLGVVPHIRMYTSHFWYATLSEIGKTWIFWSNSFIHH